MFGAALVLFFALPIALLVAAGAGGLASAARDPELARSLAITFGTATTATLVAALTGSPVAYVLARRRFSGRSLLAAIVGRPLRLPPPVAGLASQR